MITHVKLFFFSHMLNLIYGKPKTYDTLKTYESFKINVWTNRMTRWAVGAIIAYISDQKYMLSFVTKIFLEVSH